MKAKQLAKLLAAAEDQLRLAQDLAAQLGDDANEVVEAVGACLLNRETFEDWLAEHREEDGDDAKAMAETAAFAPLVEQGFAILAPVVERLRRSMSIDEIETYLGELDVDALGARVAKLRAAHTVAVAMDAAVREAAKACGESLADVSAEILDMLTE